MKMYIVRVSQVQSTKIHPTLDPTHLPLSKRNGIEFVSIKAPVLGKLEQAGHGIGTRREHKDERHTAVGVVVAPGKVKGWWLNKLVSQLGFDKVGNKRHHLSRQRKRVYAYACIYYVYS